MLGEICVQTGFLDQQAKRMCNMASVVTILIFCLLLFFDVRKDDVIFSIHFGGKYQKYISFDAYFL